MTGERLEIDLDVDPVISYASAYNGKQIVRSLSVRSTAGRSIENVEVRLALTSLGEDWAESWARRVEQLGPEGLTLNAVDLHDFTPRVNALLAQRELRRAEVRVTVHQGDELLGEHVEPVNALAASGWVMSRPLGSSAASLAAFVQPHETSLTALLREADAWLTQNGEPSGIEGYQADDPDRVDTIVTALYEAARAREVSYANPPAGWDLNGNPDTAGQRVRLSGEVLADGLATCLDSSILLCSLLELAGLRPLLIVVPGHAFVGYWRYEHGTTVDGTRSSFPGPVMPLREVKGYIDVGQIEIVESTCIAAGTMSKTAAGARRDARARLDAAFDEPEEVGSDGMPLLGHESVVVDVAAVRHGGRILPLPVRHVEDDGTVSIVEYRAAEASLDLLREAISRRGAGTATGVLSREAPLRVKRWQDALLDLSRRNPLLNFRFPERSSVSLYLTEPALGVVEDLLQGGQSIRLAPRPTLDDGRPVMLSERRTTPPQLDDQLTRLLVNDKVVVTGLAEDVFATRLRRMLTNSRSVVEETGSNGLYLALGMVSWIPQAQGGDHAAPLILIPVSLRASNRNREFALEIDPTGAITPNFSLAERLKQEFGLDLPKFIEPDTDQAGVDIDALVAYLREKFLKAGLRDFRVDPAAVLGFFDFSTYRLWRDLQQHWPRFIENSPLIKHLVESPTRAFDARAESPDEAEDASLDDFAATLPVLADASQAAAVREAMEGRTFVLQGPPGSGKSQTITNLLARALHSGKRVLFVAEKAGALGVVRDRLGAVGLGSFGLNLHDKGMRPADVRGQLSEALDAAAATDRIGYDAAQRDIDRALAPLQQYPQRLHSVGELGESAYSARNKLLAVHTDCELPVPRAFLDAVDTDALDDVRRAMRDARDVAARAGTSRDNPWSFVRSGSVESDQRAMLLQCVEQLVAAHAAARAEPGAAEYLDALESMEELLGAGVLADRVPELGVVDAASTVQAAEARAHVLSSIGDFDPEGIVAGAQPQTMDAPVAELRTVADQALDSFFIGRTKRVRRATERVLEHLGSRPPIHKGELVAVVSSIGTLQKLVGDYTTYVEAMPGVSLPPGGNLLDPDRRARLIEQVRQVDADVEFAADTGGSASRRVRALIGSGSTAAQSVGAVSRAFRALLVFFPSDECGHGIWQAGRRPGVALSESVFLWADDARNRDFLHLRRWLELRALLQPLEQLSLEEASADIQLGRVPAGEIDMAFERGFLGTVLRYQLDEQALDAFDGERHDATAREFAQAAETLRTLSPGILADDMIGNRGFAPGVDIGAVGELRRELGRQRGHKPIRKLLRDHWSVISRVTPLVLAVPDALVRFVDGDLEPFDLVVFDEASQIKVAHSIGALGRGRSAVVVGDSKQMPPTSVAQVGATGDEDDAEQEIPADEESILSESIQACVPETYLTWHYRSEDETLIAFSNHTYYDGRLRTLPAPSSSLHDKGLGFVKVDGRFVRQTRGAGANRGTNRAEAEAIVAEIGRRIADPELSQYSIGVVTLNKPQQELVQSLLVSSEDDAVLAALNPDETAEPITVWNLETVQGHERDVILFSIAFSKDDNGKLSRNFGPLVQSGGERRLNVAVTRARRQVLVFCSFEPEELRTEGMSDGLMQLADYLRIAKHGPGASGATGSRRITPPDRHRDEIAEALRERGLRVGTEIGLSEFTVDLAISSADQMDAWSVGILTDGPAWRSRATVGDRDALPLTLLADRMGWSAIARIWTPDWLRDRNGIVDRLVSLVERVESGERIEEAKAPVDAVVDSDFGTDSGFASGPDSGPERVSVAHSVSHGNSSPLETWWSEWTSDEIQPGWVLEQLHDPGTREYLVSITRSIISVEGPVQIARAAKLIGRLHGLGAVRTARVDAIDNAIGAALPRSQDGFLFLPEDPPENHEGWMRSEAGERKVDEISLVEISNVMRHIARLGLGASREELVTSSASLLGFQRVTAGIRERLELGVDEGIRRGTLRAERQHLLAV